MPALMTLVGANGLDKSSACRESMYDDICRLRAPFHISIERRISAKNADVIASKLPQFVAELNAAVGSQVTIEMSSSEAFNGTVHVLTSYYTPGDPRRLHAFWWATLLSRALLYSDDITQYNNLRDVFMLSSVEGGGHNIWGSYTTFYNTNKAFEHLLAHPEAWAGISISWGPGEAHAKILGIRDGALYVSSAECAAYVAEYIAQKAKQGAAQ